MKITLYPGKTYAMIEYQSAQAIYPKEIDETIKLLRVIKQYLINQRAVVQKKPKTK